MIKNCDCLDGLKELDDNSVDVMITDPPYGLNFMSKNWDKAIPPIDIWKECHRVLKPGSFAFIMCIPRQDCLSRMIVSLEDAGFNTNFTSIYWTFGSGFPKASNISKSIDKRLGAEREVIRISPNDRPNSQVKSGKAFDRSLDMGQKHETLTITNPVNPQAKLMDGWYTFNPKPAVEIIIVAQKQMKHKSYVDQALDYSDQVLQYQKNDIAPGCVNFDDTRIPYESDNDKKDRPTKQHHKKVGEDSHVYQLSQQKNKYHRTYWSAELTQGRFPANLLVSDDVLNDGEKYRSSRGGGQSSDKTDSMFGIGIGGYKSENQYYDNDGSFSRYFSLDAWWNDKLKHLPPSVQKTFPMMIVPKAGKSEKNKGCEGLHKKNPMRAPAPRENEKEKTSTLHHNIHPTCKPLKLMSYLITLSTRENDTILDPFLGSGTTAVACKMLGRKCVGFEISKEYYGIAKKRLQRVCSINDWI